MRPIQTIRARKRLPIKLNPISPVKIKKIERMKSSRDVIRKSVQAWVFRRHRKHAALKIENFYWEKRVSDLSSSAGSIKDRRGMKLESLRIVEDALSRECLSPIRPMFMPTPIQRESVFAFKETVPKSVWCTIC